MSWYSNPEMRGRPKMCALLCIRPFKNHVLIFGAALCFSHYMVHLMPIGTIHSKIDKCLDLPRGLWSFRVLVHTLIVAGMRDYNKLGWSGLHSVLKTHDLIPLSDAFFKVDHDELIEIYLHFIKKKIPAGRPHLWSNNNMAVQKFKMWK